MSLSRASIIAVCAILGVVASAGQVWADCMNSHAVDNCLVGKWQQTGGGAAEWMRQNLKMAQVSVTGSTLMTFNGDGTFSTSKADASAHVVAKEGKPMEATGQMSSEGSGQWSVAEGKLNLCMTAISSSGNVQMQGPNGMATKVPMPQTGGHGADLHVQRRHAVDGSADAAQHDDDDDLCARALRRVPTGTRIRGPAI